MPAWHRTKILCTLGPATDAPDILERMMRAGMDVARINTSHGDLAEHRRRIQAVRRIADALHRPVAVFVDLPGPKLRIGQLAHEPLDLAVGDRVAFGSTTHDPTVLPSSLPQLAPEVRVGETMFLADGAVRLEVTETSPDRIVARVVIGGTIRSGSGINLPDTQLTLTFPTEDDARLIAFAVEQQAEWIGVSFVRTAEDLQRVRAALGPARATLLMAKIEKRQALEALEAIVDVANGVMVARGDLGVEIELADVPLVQKRIVALANRRARPVVTATQMLESMVDHAHPTRAEVTDVANAVLDGTDGVMLSAESAIGRFPVEAVETLSRVITATEADYPYGKTLESAAPRMSGSSQEAVSLVACRLSFDLKASAIVAPVSTVRAALQIARFRPKAPIVAMTNSDRLYRQLAMVWGVVPLLTPSIEGAAARMTQARQWLAAQGDGASDGPLVVLSASSASRGFNDTLQVVPRL